VRIQFGDPRALFFIIERIRAMFDLSADWTDIARTLRSDPQLAQFVQSAPGLRVPGCWDGFELGTRAILGQQVSVACARAVAGRIAAKFGPSFSGAAGLTHLFPTPEILAQADLTKAGVTSARAQTIQALARAVCEKRINFEGVVESEPFLARLREISGIGKWTAQYIAMRALGETDAFPAADAALLRALNITSSQELEQRSEAWRPWRAYATMYLWKSLSARKVRGGNAAFRAAQKVHIQRGPRHQHLSKAV
jgi:AraC family transcriptional regulator, regulatory protein of adaptative response / DNA-3-methyladenine glycosylase II